MLTEFQVLSDPISTHIWISLHNHAFKEATFAAERLFAEAKNEESLYLLATCFYRMNRPKQIIRLLNSNSFSSPKIRYLLSKSYFDCDMLNEAEISLLGSERSSKSLSESLLDFGEQSCYAFLLLGDVYKLQNSLSKAQICYEECLKLNPLMWTAFENLCSIGAFVDPEEVFALNSSVGFVAPIFTVLGQSLPTNKSLVNVKAKRDKLGSRENVNPNCPINEVSESPLNGDPEKLTTSLGTTEVVKSTHVSQCTAPNQDFPINHSLLLDDLAVNFSPVSIPVTTVAPSAPLLNREELKTKKIGINTTISKDLPSFGYLSTVPRSPMFACLPIFSRLDLNSTNSSVLSSDSLQPFRLALHQTAVNRRLNNRQEPSNGSQLQAAILFNTNTTGITQTPSQLRSNDSKRSTPMAITPVVSGGIFGSKYTRASGITPLPPWIPNSSPASSNIPAIGSLGTTSTPAAPQNAFSLNKPLLFDGLDESGNIATPRVSNIPVGISGTAENIRRDSYASDGGGSFTEPRTRAQKARAAALASQRRSRLRRASKTSNDDLTAKESRTSLVQLAIIPELASEPPVNKDKVSEFPKMVCAASSDQKDPRTEAISAYLQLLQCLGHSFSLLTQHDYKSAVTVLSELPLEHLATGRTLTWAARAHVDAADYPKAHRIFSELNRLEPWQLYGMDLYSTVLWYQEAEQELSQLAKHLLTLDRNAPEPWTAAGNYYSLQREHDTAIRFFRRALQVCSTDAYACTLLGHEYASVDNLDRAASAFRHALRLDDRSYSARFGLSNVYFKQDYFGLADSHLVKAISIFPNSSLLLTHLGAIRARIGRLDGGAGSAIDCLNRAVSLNPTSPIALYHRACVLSSLGRYQDAIEELERLMLITPHEAMIYFMLGHAYQKVGNSPQAMIYYSWAMELDPKGVNNNLRDIMANAPKSRQQPSLGGLGTSASDPAASDTPNPVSTTARVSSRSHHRRGVSGGGGLGRSRRSARGAPAHRLFFSPTFSAATTATTTNNEGADVVAIEGSATEVMGSMLASGQAGGNMYDLSWSRRRRRASIESGVDEEVAARDYVGDGGEDWEETMEMGDS